ncbi:CDP-alcohol phosphatidyltransferase family protein [Planktothrix mougeotii]|uniref:CDP-alcohol phosphatidyltransferase family protein n=1 Tax=Planktothrix mougeotii LEGE 06226 TaxID=1828728 RepID=A0ABR9UC90_9CYAN|nr:CDP-alcohol phosphatidyltransferase family protein [Planktothrix mougeotii]MBE9144080.1 CDP-alcohol phosphatidyltransferase family protein [Planktothrix mougeotii LEGE 06226]
MFSPILRQLDLANSLTLTGLVLSFFSVLFTVNGYYNQALICMMYAGIIDLFDGFVAKKISRTELQSEVGKQLDSIVDLCSFGLSPAIFAYCFGLNDLLSITILIVYLAATTLRLAYFNATGLINERNEQYYTGLPVTYAALFIPLVFTARFVLPDNIMKLVFDGLYLLLALAMLGNFKMLKLVGIWYAIFTFGAIGLTAVYIWAIALGI